MVGEGFGMKKQERIQQIQKTPYLCKVNARHLLLEKVVL
jgi:hypothetical protein